MKLENVHLAYANTVYFVFCFFFVPGQQSNEVGGSYHMEKEGLRTSVALLEEGGINLDCIVTDRHPQFKSSSGRETSPTTMMCGTWQKVYFPYFMCIHPHKSCS